MSTFSCRTAAIEIHPGQNINDFALTKTCPERGAGPRPGQHRHLRRWLHRQGLRHPVQAEHGRDQAGRAAGHTERLGPAPPPRRLALAERGADLRLRRGEDDRQVAARATASRSARPRTGGSTRCSTTSAPRRTARSTSPGRSTGCRRPCPGAPTSSRRISAGSTSPAAPTAAHGSIRSSTPSAASIATVTASTSSPTRSRPIPDEKGYEEREKISNARQVDGRQRRRDARLRSRPPPSRRPAGRPQGGARRARRRERRRRFAGRAPTPVPLRRPLLRARRRSQLGRLDGGDPAQLADQPEAGRHGLGQHDLRRQTRVLVRVDGHPSPRLERERRPEGARPLRRLRRGQGDVSRWRDPHPRPAERERRRQGPQGPEAAGPAHASQRPAGARLGDRHPQLPLPQRRLHRRSRLPGEPDATADDRVRGAGHASPTSTPCPASRRPSRPGTASPPVARPATAAPGSATRSPPARSSSTPASSATGPAPARRSRPAPTSTPPHR